MDTFSVSQSAIITGISKPSIRKNTQIYARWLSTEATPEKGGVRTFTVDDLRLLKFVNALTTAGMTHTQVVFQLESGELERFEWRPDDEEVEEVQQSTALMPQDLARLAQSMVEEAKAREDAASLRERAAQQRIVELERQLGEVTGRLAEVKALRWRAPAWIRALFGSRGD